MLANSIRVVATFSVIVVAACSDDQPSVARQETAAQNSVERPTQRGDEWLEISEGVSPVEWLSTRSAKGGRVMGQDEMAALNASLVTAARRLGESPRMIANRSVQLEVMLHDIGKSQGAIDLIQQLTSVIGETGQTEGFGAISQHYYTMRKNGLTAEQALDDLKRRYGPRS